MKKLLSILLILANIWACSSSRDTANMTPDEHFGYAMELYNDMDYELAISEFQTILLQYPGSIVNDDAQYYLGLAYFNKEQFLLSAYEFSKLIRDIPGSPFVPDAQYMLAEAYYRLSPPYPLDQAYTKKAIEEFQAFIEFFPTNERVEEAEIKIREMNDKLAEKEYRSAMIYEKMGYNLAAIEYYGGVVESYHDTRFAPLALYNKIQLQLQRNMTGAALRDITDFLSRYPSHPRAVELQSAQNMILSGS